MSALHNFSQATRTRYSLEAKKTSCLSCGGALELAGIKEGEILADLGSGRGNDVIKASRTGKFAYGIDFTDKMIETARENAIMQKADNVDFLTGDIEKIPLEDNSLDIVISNCTINHAPDKAKVYSEIYRILKPGGRFVVSDVISEGLLPEEISSDPEAVAACYGGAIPKEDYLKAVYHGGFQDIEILEESEPYDKHGVSVISLTLRSYKP